MEEGYFTFMQEASCGESYGGRELIRTGSRLNEGVLPSAGNPYKSENLVVDWEEYGENSDFSLADLWAESWDKTLEDGKDHRDVSDAEIVEAVFDTILESMDYDKEWVYDFNSGIKDGSKVSLQNIFMDAGRGTCRHMGLAAGTVLERMYEGGYTDGTGIINQNKRDDSGHLWAEYVNEEGFRIVIDPANKYLGAPESSRWDYQPELDIEPEVFD